MTALFFAVAIIVGGLCGSLMGYETRDLNKQPSGWKPWLLFSLVGVAVVSGALLVEKINSLSEISSLTKSLALVAAAAAFVVGLLIFRRKKSSS
jgi:uncharacterized membrane protein YhiD involved in acid resistance